MTARKLLCISVFLMAAACKPSADVDGYIPDPYPDEISADKFCQWRTPPEGPAGTQAHRIYVRLPVGEFSACEEFDPDDVDEALEGEIAEECNLPVEEFTRGCFQYIPRSTGDECGFGAYYFSKCDVLVETE